MRHNSYARSCKIPTFRLIRMMQVRILLPIMCHLKLMGRDGKFSNLSRNKGTLPQHLWYRQCEMLKVMECQKARKFRPRVVQPISCVYMLVAYPLPLRETSSKEVRRGQIYATYQCNRRYGCRMRFEFEVNTNITEDVQPSYCRAIGC